MALFVGNGMRGYADAQLHLLQRFFVAQHDAGNNLRRRRVEPILRRLEMFEMLDYQIDELIVVEMSGGGYDNIAGGKAVSIGFEYGLRSNFFTVSLVPRIGLPSGWSFQKFWVKISWTR